MKVIVPGHCYELDCVETQLKESLNFIQKEPIDNADGTMTTTTYGTTNEEVLRLGVPQYSLTG